MSPTQAAEGYLEPSKATDTSPEDSAAGPVFEPGTTTDAGGHEGAPGAGFVDDSQGALATNDGDAGSGQRVGPIQPTTAQAEVSTESMGFGMTSGQGEGPSSSTAAITFNNVQQRSSQGASAPQQESTEEEYLFLSQSFVHQKLKTFNPPCTIEMQLEVGGVMQPTVYHGQLTDSRCKGYYKLTAPPKDLLLGMEIFGLRLKADGRIILQLKIRPPPLNVDEGRRRLNPRVIGITTSIRVDFLKACFNEITEPRHPVTVRVEINGVRQPELFTGASISHNRQGSFYVLGLPFALVHGREFVAWRQLEEGMLELAVQDVDPGLAAVAAARAANVSESAGTSGGGGAYSRRTASVGIIVDSRISIPLAMLKRDLADDLPRLLPGGLGPAFDIPARVQYRVDGRLLPRVYEQAVIKKSEHRGCCYLNGTERIPVKGKILVGLECWGDQELVVLDFKSTLGEDLPRRNSPSVPGVGMSMRSCAGDLASPSHPPGPGLTIKGNTIAQVRSLFSKAMFTGGLMDHQTAAELAAALVQAAEVAAGGGGGDTHIPGEAHNRRGKGKAGGNPISTPCTPRSNIIGLGHPFGGLHPDMGSAGGGGTGRSRLSSITAGYIVPMQGMGGEGSPGGEEDAAAQMAAAEDLMAAAMAFGNQQSQAVHGFDVGGMGELVQGGGQGGPTSGRGKAAAQVLRRSPAALYAGVGRSASKRGTPGRHGGRTSGGRRRGRGGDEDDTDKESGASEEEEAEQAELDVLQKIGRRRRGKRDRGAGDEEGKVEVEEEEREEEGGEQEGAGGGVRQGPKVRAPEASARQRRVKGEEEEEEEGEHGEGEEEEEDTQALLTWGVRRPRSGLGSVSHTLTQVSGGLPSLTPPQGSAMRRPASSGAGMHGGSAGVGGGEGEGHREDGHHGNVAATSGPRGGSKGGRGEPLGSSKRGRKGRGRGRGSDDEEDGEEEDERGGEDGMKHPMIPTLPGYSGEQMLQLLRLHQEAALAQELFASAALQQQMAQQQQQHSAGKKGRRGSGFSAASSGSPALLGMAAGLQGVGPMAGLGLGLGLGLGSPLSLLGGGLGLGLAGSPYSAVKLMSPLGLAGDVSGMGLGGTSLPLPVPMTMDVYGTAPTPGTVRSNKKRSRRAPSDSDSDREGDEKEEEGQRGRHGSGRRGSATASTLQGGLVGVSGGIGLDAMTSALAMGGGAMGMGAGALAPEALAHLMAAQQAAALGNTNMLAALSGMPAARFAVGAQGAGAAGAGVGAGGSGGGDGGSGGEGEEEGSA